MSYFQEMTEYARLPGYIDKLRTYYNRLAPQMIRNYKQKRSDEKGCWLVTVLPSLIDRQLRMSSNNLTLGSTMLETEFIPATHFESAELKAFLLNFDIEETLPLIIINSVKTIDNAHMIIVGKGANQTVYDLGDY